MSDTPRVTIVDLTEFKPDPANPNKGNSRGREVLDSSVKDLGAGRSLVADKDGVIVAGNKTREAMLKQGLTKAVVVHVDGDTPVVVQRGDMDMADPTGKARRYAFMDNRAGELSLTWDDQQVINAVNAGLDMSALWSSTELDALVNGPTDLAGGKKDPEGAKATQGALAARFVVPPFTILDSRQGYWQDRKRQWRAVGQGLVSDEGRDVAVFADSSTFVGLSPLSAASIFDPVVAEIAYRWFNLPAGHVLDPFAGGAVRGVVASMLGCPYTGIDLRPEQVAVNHTLWSKIVEVQSGVVVDVMEPHPVQDPAAMTAVQFVGGMWFKRDDSFTIGTAGNGGKVRTCWGLAQGATGLVTAGSRASPQVNIVAGIAQLLGIPCEVHTPSGKIGAEVQMAVDAGAKLVQHKAGHNPVIIARAREAAEANAWREIPFGMECQAAVDATRKQVANLPGGILRLVVPVGSGMSLAGILWGLKDCGRKIPVLGVVVGADPKKRLEQYAPKDWADTVTLVKSEVDYHDEAPTTEVHGIKLDPIYEAKCIPYLKEGDCMWVVGRRASAKPITVPAKAGPDPTWIVGDSLDMDTALPEGEMYDFIFSCPPYYDLEEYSDDPADLSNQKTYGDFLRVYREIIRLSVARLKPNRFACFVVGDIRDKEGAFRNFHGHTVQAFEDAGARFYNDLVLVQPNISAAVRANSQFSGMRKAVKIHQNVLVFWKGDPRVVKDIMPPCEVPDPTPASDPA